MSSELPCYKDESIPLGEDGQHPDCATRQVLKKDGRVIPLAPICLLKAIAHNAIVVDVRDDNEVKAGKGGTALDTAVHVPFNMDGLAQSERKTTLEEYKAKLTEAGVIPTDKPLVTHCTGGGRGSLAMKALQELGYVAYNGGGPEEVRLAMEAMRAKAS